MYQYIAILILGIILLGVAGYGAGQLTDIGAGIASFFLNNFYYLIGFLLFVFVGSIIVSKFVRGEISRGETAKYVAVLILLGLFVMFGIPLLWGSMFHTYKVKVLVSLYNPPFGGRTKITSAQIDYSSFQKSYVPFSAGKLPLGWFSDTVDVNFLTKCYAEGETVYSNLDKETVTVGELGTVTIEHWLYNLPAGSRCTVDIWLTGEEADPSHKIISFTVPA